MCVGVPTGMHVGTQMNRNSYHAESADLLLPDTVGSCQFFRWNVALKDRKRQPCTQQVPWGATCFRYMHNDLCYESSSGQWQLLSPFLTDSLDLCSGCPDVFDNLYMPNISAKIPNWCWEHITTFCSVLFTLADCVLNNKLWPLAIFLRVVMMRTHSSKSAGQWNKINQEFPKYNNICVH